MYVNTKKLKDITSTKISAVVFNLISARNQLSNIEMPDNFSYAAQLKNDIPNQIHQIEKEVSGIESYIKYKVNEFEKVEAKNKRISNNMSKDFMGGISNSSITNSLKGILLTSAQSVAITKSKQKNQNWVGIKIGTQNYGFYVDNNGNVVKNKNINGVEFDKDGKATDEIKFNMMVEAVNTKIPNVPFKDIPVRQDALILIDDNSYKIGILKRQNNKDEWDFDEYEDCSNAMNPAKRRLEGEYITTGQWKGKEDKTSELPNFIIDLEGKSEFFFITKVHNYNTGKANNFIHTIAYDPVTANPLSDEAVVSDGKLKTDASNGCTRTTTEVAKKIYEEYNEGVFIKVYDQKAFDEYDIEAQNDAIDEWTKKLGKVKSNEEILKIEQDIKIAYGDEVWDKVVAKAAWGKDEIAKIDKPTNTKESDKIVSNKSKTKKYHGIIANSSKTKQKKSGLK